MVLSVSARNEKQVWNEVLAIVPESDSKKFQHLLTCQECNEECRKTYVAIQTV